MPLFLIVLVIATIAVIISVRAAKKGNLGWLKSKGIDCVVFILTFTSFIFSVGITTRIAIYADEYNASVTAIAGGLIINLALWFVPGLLFISSLILALRLISRTPKA